MFDYTLLQYLFKVEEKAFNIFYQKGNFRIYRAVLNVTMTFCTISTALFSREEKIILFERSLY